MALVVGLIAVAAVPAGAVTSSWSLPFGSTSGLGGLGGLGGFNSLSNTPGLSNVYGAAGPFAALSSLGSSMGGYSPYGSSYSPYGSYYSSPTTTSNSLLGNDDFFSNFGDLFGGSLFKKKVYGTPPTENITNALVGQRLSYNSGYMGIPLQYEIEKSDIGNITGTTYQGADAWKVRVGQDDMYWDVIVDEDGNEILAESQVQ